MQKILYKMKPKAKYIIANVTTQSKLAEKVGISENYMNEIINNNSRRNGISKSLAYFICKAIDEDLEIEDLFDISNK